MATAKQLESKQSELDIIKWNDSESGTDMCGTYGYCDKCDKEKDFPCARAYYAGIISPFNIWDIEETEIFNLLAISVCDKPLSLIDLINLKRI